MADNNKIQFCPVCRYYMKCSEHITYKKGTTQKDKIKKNKCNIEKIVFSYGCYNCSYHMSKTVISQENSESPESV